MYSYRLWLSSVLCLCFFLSATGTQRIYGPFQHQLSNLVTSCQDACMGRYALLPCTTKRRTTTNLKTKSNQNCQKIKLCGSLTTKELKKKHSSRLVGGVGMGSQGRKDVWQGSGWWTWQVRQWGGAWRTRWSHICMHINWEEQLENEIDCTTQGSSMGK